MVVYVRYGEDGRLGAFTTNEKYSRGMTAVEAPEGFDPESASVSDWVYGDGAISYSPLPMPEPEPDPMEQVPQLQTIARLAMPSISFASVTATDVVSIPDYIPEWSTLIGQKLKKNSPCRYEDTIYRASQDVTVQDIYPPDVAGESQYYPIEVAPDGIIVYRTCRGDYDMVRAGERRHYPDAEGPVYLAKVDTAYDPDAVPDNWELVE